MMAIMVFVVAVPATTGAPAIGTGKTSGLSAQELKVLGVLNLDNAWNQLGYLSSLGEKVAGSPAERSAQQYVYDQFSAMPMDEVWWENFPVAYWEHYGTTLSVVSNANEPIDATTYGDCPSIWGRDANVPYHFGNTDGGKTLVANVVDVGHGTAAEFDAVGDMSGVIALVHRDDNLQGWPNTPAFEAGLHNAAAVLFYGYYAGMDNPEGIKQDSVFSPIPAISISPGSAAHIQDLMSAGPVTLKISGRVDFHPKGESVNVAAVMWGTVKPDEYVVISGHIDTWWSGSNDDQSSIAAVLEYARLFSQARAAGIFTNERTLVFCSVGAEETGGIDNTWYNWLVGSYEFVVAHPEIMNGLVVELNMDGVSMPRASGQYWAENTWELNGFVKQAIKDVGLGGLLTNYNPIWSWTDAWSFGAKGGGSTVQMIGWENGYDWTYHTALDSFDIQSKAVLNMVLKLYVLMASRAVHALVLPMDFVPTCDWAAGYLAAEKTTMPASQAANIDAASKALSSLRASAQTVNAYAAALKNAYAIAKGPAEKAQIEARADALNRALIDARRIITPYTLGEGGTMGSWDVFLRSDQHSHDYGFVNAAVNWLKKSQESKALKSLENVYTMEWGKLYSRETYLRTLDDMTNVFMYWGDDFDQQQMYVDVQGVYLGLKDGTMTNADAIHQLSWIDDNQLVPWFAEDVGTLSWAWTEGSAILTGAVA
jgi:Iap family predicted aminopeptidase